MEFTKELYERMMCVDPAQIGHYIQNGYMSPSIKPVFQKAKIAGPAVTVWMGGNDNAMLYYAIEHAKPGSVIVVDRGEESVHACCGDVVALVAQLNGIAGIVIDGMATDSIGIEELEFPVFCKGFSPITTNLLCQNGLYNVPVQCGGAAVTPGDIIFGDADGVIVIPPDRLEDLLVKAEKANINEAKMKEEFCAGKQMSDYFPGLHSMVKQL
ncbi:RraA family protein [Oscillospiraceae bacterium LTW-04]|nr:RraA family protein [Oscillospiraceae bacterium MB24-C1]